MDAEAAAHREACAACAEFAERTRGLEADLERVARVEPPAGLAERVLQDTVAPQRRPLHWWGVAAGLVVVALASLLWPSAERQDRLLALIEHVHSEEPKELARGRVGDPAMLAAAIQTAGIELPGDFEVRYLGRCPMDGWTAEHVVIRSPSGEATLLLLPEESMATRVSLSTGGLDALVGPAVRGSYALVARSPDELNRVAGPLGL